MEKVKPVILAICNYYLPGFEGGGTLRALVNLVDRLGDDYCFKLITRDHDGPLNRKSYENVQLNDWNRVGKADVYYLSKNNIRIGRIRSLIQETKPDAIYLNSFFSPLTIFTLLLRKFKKIDPIPIVLAPEGELIPGGLRLKPLKKSLYIKLANSLQLLQYVTWKVASDYELDQLRKVCNPDGKIFIAPSLSERVILGEFDADLKPEKHSGSAKMVFLSRFMRKKNFKWLLEHISTVKGELSIDVYGPIEDAEYWLECQQIIKTLPENIKIEAKGAIPYEQVADTLTKYHFFVLPTLGENFGLVFIEALAAGCPLIISDISPWRNLEKQGVGWDLSLEKPEAWLAVINSCVEMNNEDYRKMSKRAREFAVAWLSDPSQDKAYKEVFEQAMRC
ncbi:MAG: glycosyltransferase family 4 protein [Pyrinomonadaceae bacterium]